MGLNGDPRSMVPESCFGGVAMPSVDIGTVTASVAPSFSNGPQSPSNTPDASTCFALRPVASASTVISSAIGSSGPFPSWGGAAVVFPTIAPSVFFGTTTASIAPVERRVSVRVIRTLLQPTTVHKGKCTCLVLGNDSQRRF